MNWQERFIDTGYWLGFVNSDDAYHNRARILAMTLKGPYVTTEAVLVELGNTLGRWRWRRIVIPLLEDIRTDRNLTIVPVTTDLLDRAIALYTSRPDKEWGLTDRVSFVVMRDRGLTEALAADQHFVQAGFRALLRE